MDKAECRQILGLNLLFLKSFILQELTLGLDVLKYLKSKNPSSLLVIVKEPQYTSVQCGHQDQSRLLLSS